jgi:hypothetical protein
VTPGDVLDEVLVDLHLVGLLDQRRVAQVDLSLAGRGDLVVMGFDADPHLVQRPHDF